MTTTVYSMPSLKTPARRGLICHLRSTSPAEAITALEKAGILAVQGPDAESIVLVGFHVEVIHYLEDLRAFGRPMRPDAQFYLGKLSARFAGGIL